LLEEGQKNLLMRIAETARGRFSASQDVKMRIAARQETDEVEKT
jgi:hypothetical protein